MIALAAQSLRYVQPRRSGVCRLQRRSKRCRHSRSNVSWLLLRNGHAGSRRRAVRIRRGRRSNLRLRRTASRRSRGMGYGQRAMGEDLDACLRHATQAIARVAALVLRGDSSPSSSVTRSATRYSSISTIELAALLDCASVERCVRVAARHDNVYGSSSESRRVGRSKMSRFLRRVDEH